MSTPNPLQDEVISSKIALLIMSNPSIKTTEMAKTIGVTVAVLKRVMATGAYRELIDKAARDQLTPIIAKGKSDLVNLLPEAVRVFKELLAENNIEAAKQVVKIAIPEAADDKPVDTTINVILPGNEEKVIEVKE